MVGYLPSILRALGLIALLSARGGIGGVEEKQAKLPKQIYTFAYIISQNIEQVGSGGETAKRRILQG